MGYIEYCEYKLKKSTIEIEPGSDAALYASKFIHYKMTIGKEK